MWNPMMGQGYGYGGGFPSHMWGWVFPLVILDVILKGFALWRSARSEQKWWFIAILLINSLGILPLIYLLTHPEKKSSKKK